MSPFDRSWWENIWTNSLRSHFFTHLVYCVAIQCVHRTATTRGNPRCERCESTGRLLQPIQPSATRLTSLETVNTETPDAHSSVKISALRYPPPLCWNNPRRSDNDKLGISDLSGIAFQVDRSISFSKTNQSVNTKKSEPPLTPKCKRPKYKLHGGNSTEKINRIYKLFSRPKDWWWCLHFCKQLFFFLRAIGSNLFHFRSVFQAV